MRITSVTVGMGITVSLPDYCNVKPSLTLTATVDTDDDVKAVVLKLESRARTFCEGVIDDELELNGRSPKYYAGPLFHLYEWWQRGALVILPTTTDVDDFPGTWSREIYSGQRFETMLERAYEMAEGREVIESLHPVEIQEWWDERAWYRGFGLKIWRDHWQQDIGQLVCVRDGLELADELVTLQSKEKLTSRPRLLKDLQEAMRKDGYNQDCNIVDTQEELDELMAVWMAEHPRSGEKPF